MAVVSPREECRSSARVWAPLLSGRADVSTCADPADVPDDAGLVVVASAYQVRGHGGEIGAPMVVRFLKRVAERPELAEHYLGRRGR